MIIVMNREMIIPDTEQYIGTTYDNESENRVFRIRRFSQRGVDLSALTFRLDLKYANAGTDALILSKEVTDEFIFLTWEITSSQLQVPGTVKVGIRAIDNEATVKWSTFTAAFYAERHLNTPGNYTGDLTEIEQMEQDHQYMMSVVDELRENLDYRQDAEAYAVGKRLGEDVPETDDTYHNNSKYYKEVAEAYAKGTVDGVAVESSDTGYHDNSKYYSELAAASEQTAADTADAIVASRNQISTNATNIAAQTARIDNIIALPSGSTTGDAELQDIRVGQDGTTYGTAGTAVRTQIGDLKGAFDGMIQGAFREIDIGTLTSGKYVMQSNGSIASSTNWSRSEMLPVNQGALCFTCPLSSNSTQVGAVAAIAFYSSDNPSDFISPAVPIQTGTLGEMKVVVAQVPSTAKYIRISIYTSSVNNYHIYNICMTGVNGTFKTINTENTIHDMNDLEYNKIYLLSNSSYNIANRPYPDWSGIAVTLSYNERYENGVFQSAFDNIGGMYFRLLWTDKWTRWFKKISFDDIGIHDRTVVFSSTTPIVTDISVVSGNTYRIYPQGYEGNRINIYSNGSGGSENYVQINSGTKFVDLIPTVSGKLSLYNMDGYTGSVAIKVLEGDALKVDNLPRTYYVGANEENTSLTALLLSLKGDKREKKIIIRSGDYDIFQEYKDLQDAGKLPVVPTSDYNPSSGYVPYNVFVPDNTHIIGEGIVKLNYMPDGTDTYANEASTLSPINTAGTMTLENVEIHQKNGRYCIHDDPLQDPAYNGAIKKYINVKCVKYTADIVDGTGLGSAYCFGCGVAREMTYMFENCEFETKSTYNGSRTLYFHDRKIVGDVTLTEEMSSRIIVRNSRFITASENLSMFFGNIGAALNIRVDIENCWSNGNIVSADEANWQTGTNPNSYNLTVQKSTYKGIIVRDENNPYVPRIFN